MLTKKDFIELANDQSDMRGGVLIDIWGDAHHTWTKIGFIDMDSIKPVHATYCSANGLKAWRRNVNRMIQFCHGQNPNFDEGQFMSYIIDKKYSCDLLQGMKDAVLYVNDSNKLALDIPSLVKVLKEYCIKNKIGKVPGFGV